MTLIEASGLTTAPAASADASYAQLWNTSATKRLRLREVGFTNTAATAMKIAVKRVSARGTNTTTQLGTTTDNSADTVVGTLDLTYSVDSTKTGNYLRRGGIAAIIGSGLIWQWWNNPDGLVVPVSAGVGIVVPTAVAGIALEMWAVWEE